MTTLAEVKEQVLKYIPVMARPLVLLREQHPVRWTGVYADIEVGLSIQPLLAFWYIKVTLVDETWCLANTNEFPRSSKTNLKFMQNSF